MKQETAQKILKKTKANYDELAVAWDRTRQYLWPGSEEFLKYIKDGDKILDAGCGNGRLVKLFDHVNIDYTGIDNSEELIKIAKNNFPEKSFFVGDVLKLPFPNGSFTVIFCWAVLHHLPGKKLRKQALLELKRVLKPGGILILMNWHYSSPKMMARLAKFSLAKIMGKSELDFGDVYLDFNNQGVKRYIHLFTKPGIKKVLKQGGFKVIENYISPPTKREFKNITTIARA